MKVRVKFAKYGALRFIGHLDVMRFFQKALRRAGIDVAYTTGFSPHQIMSFASPLGLGMCSRGEYMDIEINSHNGEADMVSRLNAACVPGIEVINVRALPDTAGNAMASVAAARYTVHCKEGETDFSWLADAVSAFLAKEEIFVTKETKKGTSELNIRPGIYELFVRPDGLLEMMVDASSAGNIKPALLLDALWKDAGMEEELPIGSWQLTRLETYTNTGSAEAPVFTALDEVGETF